MLSEISTVISGGMTITNGYNLYVTCEKASMTKTAMVPVGDPYDEWVPARDETHTYTDEWTDTNGNTHTQTRNGVKHYDGHYEQVQNYEKQEVAKAPEKNDGLFTGKIIPAVNVAFGAGSSIADGMDVIKAVKKGDKAGITIQSFKLLGDGLMIAGGIAALAAGNVTVGYAATMMAGASVKAVGDIAAVVKKHN